METTELIFGLPSIAGLLPLIIYIILSFKEDMNPVVNVFICALIGAILVKQPIMQLGSVIAASTGSFLALIGLIIMLGSGLGSVLKKTGVAENLINILMTKIGVNTEKKAILATMITSVVLVTLLGTLAGANAVIAPIVIPLVASMGITPSTVAVIFQGAGQTGLFLGPFSPPVVTIMQITGLTYPQVLMYAGIPVAGVMWVVTYFRARKTQKETFGVYKYELNDQVKSNYQATAEVKRATTVFLIVIMALIAYGIYAKGGASYAILIMVVSAVCTGVASGIRIKVVADTFFEGMARLVWMFVMFLIFEPFLMFVEKSGAFKALFEVLTPLIQSSGEVMFSVVAALIGVFGINGAAVAQALLMDSLFGTMAKGLGVHMGLWAAVLLVGSQITSFAYPGGDMLGQMGLARSNDLKSMLKMGYSVILATMTVVIVLALIL